MNEQLSALKFLLWGGAIALGLTGTLSLSRATYRMAETAVKAQSKNQLSYGAYSRMLWSSHSARARPRKNSR
jgi:hypothetical protein